MQKSNTKWFRYRFHANLEDSRPVIWPPLGPYWQSGFAEEYSVVIAYMPPKANLKKYWPEASEVDYTEEEEISYTDRFPKPDWWNDKTSKATALKDL